MRENFNIVLISPTEATSFLTYSWSEHIWPKLLIEAVFVCHKYVSFD